MLKYLKICVFILAAQVAFAGNGVFEGNVTDNTTGETIAGAKVTVQETGEVVYTDFDGNFTVKGIETGKLTLEITSLGYKDAVAQQVIVEEKCIKINIGLTEK